MKVFRTQWSVASCLRKVACVSIIFIFQLSIFNPVQAQKDVYITDINEGWKTKAIENVPNGSIGILLEAFHKTWPTYVTRDACKVMEQGLSHKVLGPEAGYQVTIDATNGYAEVDDDGTDGLYMQACIWNRSNGHKLFAIMIGKPTDPELEVVCFYDYDAKAKRLTPEPQILSDFHRQSDNSQISHKLPRKGKELVIIEYDLPIVFAHHFAWNGMQPVFEKVEFDRELMKEFDEPLENEAIPVKFKGAKPEISDFVTALLSRPELGEAVNDMVESWGLHLKGKKLPSGRKITVDTKNGYVRYDATSSDGETAYIEYCFWNCADGKHKLVAENVSLLINGEPVDTELTGLTFYWYDNASKKLSLKYAFELGADIEWPEGAAGSIRNLPRQGKTIEFIYSTAKGKITKKLTWDGNKFVK